MQKYIVMILFLLSSCGGTRQMDEPESIPGNLINIKDMNITITNPNKFQVDIAKIKNVIDASGIMAMDYQKIEFKVIFVAIDGGIIINQIITNPSSSDGKPGTVSVIPFLIDGNYSAIERIVGGMEE